MSRIGKLPIEISKDVKLNYNDSVLFVQGPLGKLSRRIMHHVTLDISDSTVTVTCNSTTTAARSAYGLTRTLINNMVTGVTKGFQKNLEINGVGYRAEVKGKQLLLNLGYSHQITYDIPDGINIEVDKMTKLLIKGYDKELVGQTSAKIRSFRPPEPYKGKGIKYADETILRKAGKTGKK